MSFFSDERANELRNLFFESAQELLQALNEEGLELEKHPSDTEIIRTIRRTVHTLKGDSAACGFTELSELAHAMEDVLTPELALREDGATAQLVLTSADVFDSMLSAYRADVQPPSAGALRAMIESLKNKPSAPTDNGFNPTFDWSEYERLVVENRRGEQAAVNVAVQIDPQCPMRSAAAQLVRNVMCEGGQLLLINPEDVTAQADVVKAVVATDRPPEWFERKCKIPSITTAVVVTPYVPPSAPAVAAIDDDLLALEHQIETVRIVEAPLEAAGPEQQQVNVAERRSAPTPKESSQSEDHTEAPTIKSAPAPVQSDNILRVDAERIDAVLNLVGELIIGKSMLHQTVNEFGKRFPKDPLRGKFADTMALQAQVLNELQRSVMKIRMVPVEQLFRRFPRVVRDIAKKEAKEVELVLSGQDTDLDKSILDALAEPLAHLVRNAVDHGLEQPMERIAAGKPAQATVKLDAYHQGNHVVIEVSDDGRGIDPQRVITKAIERGVVTAEQASRLTDSEIIELIFEPGFSTAEKVTSISGRGVGLDVVKTVLERMKGSVSVRSEVGQGTSFLLKVPLTLAIIRALLFTVKQKMYAVPLNSVAEIARATEPEIHHVDGHEVLRLRDQVLTLVRLDRLLPGAKEHAKASKAFIIVISVGERKAGLIVDRLVGEQELVIKALDDHLVATDLVSGASILGDGTVVLILNLATVVERLGRIRGSSAGADVRNGHAANVGAVGAYA